MRNEDENDEEDERIFQQLRRKPGAKPVVKPTIRRRVVIVAICSCKFRGGGHKQRLRRPGCQVFWSALSCCTVLGRRRA